MLRSWFRATIHPAIPCIWFDDAILTASFGVFQITSRQWLMEDRVNQTVNVWRCMRSTSTAHEVLMKRALSKWDYQSQWKNRPITLACWKPSPNYNDLLYRGRVTPKHDELLKTKGTVGWQNYDCSYRGIEQTFSVLRSTAGYLNDDQYQGASSQLRRLLALSGLVLNCASSATKRATNNSDY